MIAAPPLTLEFHALGLGKRQALIEDVREGLSRNPKELPPRWFYDEAGSQLFELITELPEYYQTRTEASILRQGASEIVDLVRPGSLVELGAGSSTKTRILLDAGRALGVLDWFVPFDVSEEIVRQSSLQLLQDMPGLSIYAIIGDFFEHLNRIPRLGTQLIVFLGGTIGNFFPEQRQQFLRSVRDLMSPGDGFLLGMDLVKEPAELVAAYDDAQGVTARFNLNVLEVINRELDANFSSRDFQHVALYDEAQHRIEMHLESRRRQQVRIPGAEMEVWFAAGERMRTEISTKFTRPQIEQAFDLAGLDLTEWYTDERGRFALALATCR